MDIDLLAKMVKEAILDNDSVTLPGVGSFVAELMPSTFSDKGYTIHPPYRRLYFLPKQGNDTLLVDMYASANASEGVDTEKATRILTGFLAEMKEVLKVRKTVVFPGLGRLRATRENHFFFVADEDLDIYPEGFGLGPVSLKTHEETPEEVASAVAGLAGMMSEPLSGSPATGEPVADDLVFEDAPAGEGSAPAPVVPEPEPVASEPVVPEPVVSESADEPEPEEPAPVEEVPAGTAQEPVAALSEAEVENPFAGYEDAQKEEYKDFRRQETRRKVLTALLIVLGVLVLLLIVLVVAGHFAPEWLDRLLYSKEELEILRYE